jgi:hypothetical protein
MEIACEGMGRPLRNTVHWIPKERNTLVTVQTL